MRSLGIALAAWVALGAVAAGAEDASAPASTEADLPPWELEVMPYGWVPRVQVKLDDPVLGSRHFDASMKDILQNLDIAAMGRVTGRWQRLVGVVDVFWAKLEEDDSATVGPVRFDLDAEQKMTLLQALAGYRLLRRPGGLFGNVERGEHRELGFDLLAGLHYSRLENTIKPKLLFPQTAFQRKIQDTTDWVAPALGFRIQNDFTSRLRFENVTTIGGFGAGDAPDITWVIDTLLSYRFTDHWLFSLGHRAVIVNGTEGTVANLSMNGPMIGIGVRF